MKIKSEFHPEANYFTFALVLAFYSISANAAVDHQWTWHCQAGKCAKTRLDQTNASLNMVGPNLSENQFSINACKLACGHYSILWPKPTGYVQISSELTHIDHNNIYFQSLSEMDLPAEVHHLVQELGKVFIKNVHANLVGRSRIAEGGRNLHVSISIQNPSVTSFTNEADESYELTVSERGYSVAATIKAETYLGVRHGTETLSQLIIFDDHVKELIIPSVVTVQDRPEFPHRGLLLDTARNFFSVDKIRRVLDAMAASKLNTFHWHINDAQSFPMQSVAFPQLTKYGSYSPEKVYSHDDIQSIIEYAKVRGIRVIPELDAPGHVGEGWSHLNDGKPEQDLLACFNARPWQQYCTEPPCGQLNPTSERVYDMLLDIYTEMGQLFESDIFHMGGSEININCWNSTNSIVNWMKKSGLGLSAEDFFELWDIFQRRALERLEKANPRVRHAMLWTSSLTLNPRLTKYLDPAKYVIHINTKASDKSIGDIVANGYPVVFSNQDALYLFCGVGSKSAKEGECSPYVSWQKIYENNPLTILKEQGVDPATAKNLTLGQEILLWSEQTDEKDIDVRLWPRAAAMAERTWSNPQESWRVAKSRFLHHRERLAQRGFGTESIETEWCYQNEGACEFE
ncbi:chitooligosaccharidolytic beta-N-acetylglucosaminidase-like [Bemisia tabaci]|uniref:chitooligosaccharidolytic beta-N-acetylglucosaminidase n=1 Tax=Bemisia tabaci TaxID=7038 RepID=UPI003B28D892